MIESTNGIWIRRGSKDHHQSIRGYSPIVGSSVDAIQCHIRRVCNLDFVRRLCCCWNVHRICICSMVLLVNKSNCLWQIRVHRSNSAASYRLLLCRIQCWWHNNYQLWIDMHTPVLVALSLRHIHQIYNWNQIHLQHHHMHTPMCRLAIAWKFHHPIHISFHSNGTSCDRVLENRDNHI